MQGEEFRRHGYALIDRLASFLDNIPEKRVTTGESPTAIQDLVGTAGLPESGEDASLLLQKATQLLLNHSLLNGHPKFLGYITGAGAPIGALGDLLATTVNPNVGANILSPMATAIEQQTVKWLVEFIGLPANYGGILVSGGNMANFTAFLAARTAKAPKNLKEDGLKQLPAELTIYCSKTTHTWIEKAAVLFGHGTGSIRWIPADEKNKMDNRHLEKVINEDAQAGKQPFIVVGTAGDVSTGAVDNMQGIADICKKYNCWFHVDGAYGIPAAIIPEQQHLFKGITEADSIAMDPHKWLYSPLEAGCTLVKDPNHLTDTYSSHPVYYNFGNHEEALTQNYYEYGFQNSRGFRALKVWLMLQQVGKQGYIKMIGEDIRLSVLLFKLAGEHPELEALTQNLSIATFRYVPEDVKEEGTQTDIYLNKLNETLCNQLQEKGEVFLSNAMVDGKYCLRGCIVNFRTSEKDIEEIIEIVTRQGKITHQALSTGAATVNN
jgi:glutamate/tyrosine decarboxylase-like PLP-dependent enzyme